MLDGSMVHATSSRSRFDLKAFMPERVGAEISKRYHIDPKEIGSGGYGKVFVAQDRQVQGRKVAIKKVMVFDEAKKKAFQNEVSIMKTLDHPNICKLLETYEQGRFLYFVMELCEGREVFDRIMDNGQIEEATTADIVKQSASALKYAHTRGIAHRDMKPENICFATNDPKDNHIKVIDWGLGFYFGEARMSSAVGSLTYAAPEVLEARAVDGYSSACDLWSLGVLVYVMLCGKPPFWGNYAEQLKRMKKESYPLSDSTWQAISKEAKHLIKGLLRANPKDRMPLDEVLNHRWLGNPAGRMDAGISRQVLSNMKQFSKTSQFFSLCVASVARQLDHHRLRDVHRVFCEMDTNRDGVLELNEVKAGFEKIFGKESQEVQQVEAMFARLDLDGSGQIDYTEFCAAGIGERMSTEESVLWAAFKAFDVHDDNNSISKEEIKQVLRSADVDKVYTSEACDDLSDELFARYDKNGDGSLDFDEFMKLMREIAKRHRTSPSPVGKERKEVEFMEALDQPAQPKPRELFQQAYNTLAELDREERAPLQAVEEPETRSEGGGFLGIRSFSMGLGASSSPSRGQAQTSTCFACAQQMGAGGQKDRCGLM